MTDYDELNRAYEIATSEDPDILELRRALQEAGVLPEERENMKDIYDKANINDSDTYNRITKKILHALEAEIIYYNQID